MDHTARDLSNHQWKVLYPLIPERQRRNDGRGHQPEEPPMVIWRFISMVSAAAIYASVAAKG